MNCIIIDDEATARAIIAQLCSNVNSLNVLEEFPNAIQAIKYLNQNDIDLIFLDIHMPDFTGFDFIETLKNPPKIILTTSDSKFAIQAFEYDCIVDYLVKPIASERFQKAIKKAEVKSMPIAASTASEKVETTSGNDLYVNIDRRLIKIDIPSIYLVEAKGDYIHVKTENQNYTVHSTLKKIEEKLPNDLFLKVHRSFIINVNKIIDIEDNSVLIKKDVIPVSRSNRPELMKRLNLL
ncbi:LytTR family DNA-binding domain-containing protein [uncultured Psychroserpens sp.]|uniref:LytR/AlgR family response regulator transcription factor n=1 Tax=uncultured Psychroserpens sp. TaxID=255436 RepID=UPI00260B95DD|nr:LytTR family DNA-binding domain-containing protein [uncultured Psychroserpens sp.]